MAELCAQINALQSTILRTGFPAVQGAKVLLELDGDARG